MLRPWWERFSGRFEYECGELDRAGITWERDEESFKRGRVVLRLRANIDGENLNLLAKFPYLYPYFRFELYAPDLDLPHHQNPFSKNLCLIGSGTENWRTKDTLAAFIQEQLPLVLRAARSSDKDSVAGLEEHQAEPFTYYYVYEKNSLVLVDSSWELDPSVEQGKIEIGVDPRYASPLRGAILKVQRQDGTGLAQADPSIASLYSDSIVGRWCRTPGPVQERDPKSFLASLFSQFPALANPKGQQVGSSTIDIIGVLFSEEFAWRRNADAWIFLVRVRRDRKGFRPGRNWEAYLARTGRSGRADMSHRVPELLPLSKRRIAVIGLGCIGAPSVLEFARAGVADLRIMDHDTIDPGTVVRWPFGLPATGRGKAEVLSNFIRTHYPYSCVSVFDHKLGEVDDNRKSDLAVLDDFLDGVDLIFDATAEVGAERFMYDLAMEHNIPFVCISATPGGWGGQVARMVPGRTQGCWRCLQNSFSDDSIALPPQNPREYVQPAGCAAPTFTGANFDVTEISLTGVRLAVSTLCLGEETGYPDLGWDVAILSLRDSAGRPVPPTWQTYTLDKHPKCRACTTK